MAKAKATTVSAIQNALRLATPISNVDLWNAARNASPSFLSLTSKGTRDMFTENGYEQIKNVDSGRLLNEFFNLSIRAYLQKVDVSRAQDILSGVFESYYMNLGAVIQRLTVNPLKPVSPAYHNIPDRGTVDPFIIRKPDTVERFWHNPVSFQNFVTLQDYQMKEIFISEFGMSDFASGIIAQLAESLTAWKAENKFNAISTGINSTDFPLKPASSVGVTVEGGTDVTNLNDNDYKKILLAFRQAVTAMTVQTRTDAFNSAGFSSLQDKSRLKMLVRAGIKDSIDVLTLAGAFQDQYLGFPFEIVEVPHFGGLEPYSDADFTTPLFPVYDSLGIMIGWNTVADSTTVTVEDGAQYYKDPNENVIAIICDQGWLFETVTNEVRSDSIWNPRGLYMNTFLAQPNYYTSIDSQKNIVVFSVVQPEPTP